MIWARTRQFSVTWSDHACRLVPILQFPPRIVFVVGLSVDEVGDCSCCLVFVGASAHSTGTSERWSIEILPGPCCNSTAPSQCANRAVHCVAIAFLEKSLGTHIDTIGTHHEGRPTSSDPTKGANKRRRSTNLCTACETPT